MERSIVTEMSAASEQLIRPTSRKLKNNAINFQTLTLIVAL
jgi:hypothetical protein